jgi:MFS family permease
MFYGWYIVGCAFLVAVCGWGFGFYGPGVYLASLRSLYGWPTALVSLAVTLYYLCSATWIIFIGDAIERFGPRRVVLVGCCAMGAGVALLAAAQAPWQTFASFVVMSFGWAAMSGAAINAIVAPWFEKKRGLAVSLALNGSSCGGVFVTPLLVLLTTKLGFQSGLYVAVAGMLAVMIPVSLVLRRAPKTWASCLTGAIRQARISRRRTAREAKQPGGAAGLPCAIGPSSRYRFPSPSVCSLRSAFSPTRSPTCCNSSRPSRHRWR